MEQSKITQLVNFDIQIRQLVQKSQKDVYDGLDGNPNIKSLEASNHELSNIVLALDTMNELGTEKKSRIVLIQSILKKNDHAINMFKQANVSEQLVKMNTLEENCKILKQTLEKKVDECISCNKELDIFKETSVRRKADCDLFVAALEERTKECTSFKKMIEQQTQDYAILQEKFKEKETQEKNFESEIDTLVGRIAETSNNLELVTSLLEERTSEIHLFNSKCDMVTTPTKSEHMQVLIEKIEFLENQNKSMIVNIQTLQTSCREKNKTVEELKEGIRKAQSMNTQFNDTLKARNLLIEKLNIQIKEAKKPNLPDIPGLFGKR